MIPKFQARVLLVLVLVFTLSWWYFFVGIPQWLASGDPYDLPMLLALEVIAWLIWRKGFSFRRTTR